MTCHHVYNYGATLQAYALQHYLQTLGHEVEIIDYRLPSHRRYEWSYIHPMGRLYNLSQKIPLLKWPICIYRNWNFLKTWGRKKAFDKFDKQQLRITDKTYWTTEELRSAPPKADIYIAGSDQIWNTDTPNGKMPGYYLDFGDNNIRRISYAASFGVAKIAVECEDFVRNEVGKLDAVSVRENSGAKILADLGIKEVEVVCDPVFLLSQNEWSKLAGQSRTYNLDKDSYILLYDFIGDKKIETFARKMSQITGKPIVSINDFENRTYATFNINNAGPLEFLGLMKNASAVVCNSFHATAFSVIFEKDFYSFPLKTQNNSSRMRDFLNIIGLQGRFNQEQQLPKIHYEQARTSLLEYIGKGKHFLQENVK